MKDKIRVLRIVEYVGEREVVEDQIRKSLHGTKELQQGTLYITAITLSVFPESIKEHSDQSEITKEDIEAMEQEEEYGE